MNTKNKRKILILVNHDVVIYNFRLELVEQLILEGYEVFISSPYGDRINDLIRLGCNYIETNIARHGKNPLKDLKLVKEYIKMIRNVSPDIILTFTIKPNIYGGLAAMKQKTPYIANITGLGTAIENIGIMQKVTVFLYKLALRKVKCLFFQNRQNLQFFLGKKIISKNYKLVPGSGVNLNRFPLLSYPMDDNVKFVFVSRIMKEKGIEEFLKAARKIKAKYPKTQFHICGFCEENYEKVLKNYEKKGIVIYHGMVRDIKEILKICHCVVLPSYHEGMSNSLLEAAATGRPIIASNIHGCKETFKENVSGFGVRVADGTDLMNKMEYFIQLSSDERKKMGLAGREKMKEFDRNIIVNEYMKEIDKILMMEKI